jgi:diguanylate cyclase (GGDEF)-like protein/PAS domain S-box-containing protein
MVALSTDPLVPRNDQPRDATPSSGHDERFGTVRDPVEETVTGDPADTLYRMAFAASSVGLGVLTAEGRWLEANPALCALLGYTREELLAAPPAHPPVVGQSLDPLANAPSSGASYAEVERHFTRPDGTEVWVQVVASAVPDSRGRVGRYVVQIQDVTLRRQKEERLRTLSLLDDLTGLYNRRAFLAMAAEQCKAARRQERDLLLLFIDIDAMKWINDTLGHLEGDRAIRDVAAVLRSTFREADLVARLGGDEFAVLAEGGARDADALVRRLRDRLEGVNDARVAASYRLSLSIGGASLETEDAASLEELLARADARMYLDKVGRSRA